MPLRIFQHPLTIVVFRVWLFMAASATLYLSTIRIDAPLPGGYSDKVYHGACFFVLAFLTNRSFPASKSALRLYVPVFMYGVFIECVQFFLPYRSFSAGDMIADGLGILLYIIIIIGITAVSENALSEPRNP